MRLLLIGGTRFVGRHIAQAAIEAGHEVTLFNRGLTNPGLFPDAEHVRGDRQAGGLDGLHGRHFDAIVDSSAYFPAEVEVAARIAAERYVLVSTGSVYRDPVAPGSDEHAPTIELDGPVPETIDSADAYGALKVMCERAAEQRFPDRTLVLRCGLVVGPHDHTERFVYWVRRVARGGAVLAAEPDQPVQFIDARDLGAWTIAAAEAGTTGVFNTVGPAEKLTFSGLLDACVEVSGSDARAVWAGERFLLEHGVVPWSDLPLWLPAVDAGFLAVDTAAAQRAGLRTRPPAETIAEVLRWDAGRDPGERRDAMAPEREAELLALLAGREPAPGSGEGGIRTRDGV